MTSFFQKLGEQAEKEVKPYIIQLFEIYIKNNLKITPEIKELAQPIACFDYPDIFENIPSQEVREGIVYAFNIANDGIPHLTRELPTLEETKDLLKRLKKSY